MRIYCCILFMLLASCSSPDVATSTSSGGVAGVAGSASGGQAGAGGDAAGTTGAGAGGTMSPGGQAGAAGSGGCVLDPQDGNPCTSDAMAPDGCSAEHAAEPDGELCSVAAQFGRCVAGNCIVGVLSLPTCNEANVGPPQDEAIWLAQRVTFSTSAKLTGAAAIVPMLADCAGVARRIRLSVPVAPASPEGQTPEGVAVARELVLDPGNAWSGDGLPWIGAREDGLLFYAAGQAVWLEAEVPAGACAVACSTGEPGFLCSAADAGALHSCTLTAAYPLAPLGF